MKIALVLDPIHQINPKKDSSIAIAKSSLDANHETFFIAFESLSANTNESESNAYCLAAKFKEVQLNGVNSTFNLGDFKKLCLDEFDVIFMRKDPPFNQAFLYATFVLSLAEKEYGTLVINPPNCLRDFNEKFFITHFAKYAPKTIITQSEKEIREFVATEKKAVIKPLDAMGGESIFILKDSDLNLSSILEMMIRKYSFVILQKYLEEISDGDNRVLIIDGFVYDYGVKRMPKTGDFRGNTAKGASCIKHQLSASQKKMCEQFAKEMSELGIVLSGIDLIGDKITEINITSPTCFREYMELFGVNVGAKLIAAVEKRWLGTQK